jgi:hypothetical protein
VKRFAALKDTGQSERNGDRHGSDQVAGSFPDYPKKLVV